MDANENKQPPQPDDYVLLPFKESFALVVRKLREARQQIAELETAKLVQQRLVDNHERRLETVEKMLGLSDHRTKEN